MELQNNSRKCPRCGGSGKLKTANGVGNRTYYCECEECGLRTRDCKTPIRATLSWNTDKEEYFFLQERLI